LDIGPESLTLARMAEYRIGRRHSVSRVKDFSRLTRYLRKHPEAFSNNGGELLVLCLSAA